MILQGDLLVVLLEGSLPKDYPLTRELSKPGVCKRSVLVMALFHSAYNSATSSEEARFTQELISGPAVLVIPIAILGIGAVVVAILIKAVSLTSPSAHHNRCRPPAVRSTEKSYDVPAEAPVGECAPVRAILVENEAGVRDTARSLSK